MSTQSQQLIENFKRRYSKIKVALVHEFLVQYGGAERVLEAIAELFPNASIYTIVYDPKRFGSSLAHRTIHTSFLQKTNFSLKHYKKFLTLMPRAIESFNLSDYDLVISNSSSFAKGARTKKPTLHLCYCHTPTRFVWLETEYYVKTTGVPKVLQPFVIILLKNLRKWDYQAAHRPDLMLANSKNVQERIKTIYHRDCEVLYPFVNMEHFSIGKGSRDYYLAGGRLVQYKRYDLAIKAFNKLKKPLIIFGEGQDRLTLEKIVSNLKIRFVGRVNDTDLGSLYNRAKAYLYPGEEDFGIQPLEAMASGTPVIAYSRGGALETITPNKTGVFFDEQTPEALIDAIHKFEQKTFHPQVIRRHALSFSRKQFIMNMIDIIDRAYTQHKEQYDT